MTTNVVFKKFTPSIQKLPFKKFTVESILGKFCFGLHSPGNVSLQRNSCVYKQKWIGVDNDVTVNLGACLVIHFYQWLPKVDFH